MLIVVEFCKNFLMLYKFILVATILLSWVDPDPANWLVKALHRVTEPLLAPARRVIPPLGAFDLSPLAVFAVLMLIDGVVLDSVAHYAS